MYFALDGNVLNISCHVVGNAVFLCEDIPSKMEGCYNKRIFVYFSELGSCFLVGTEVF